MRDDFFEHFQHFQHFQKVFPKHPKNRSVWQNVDCYCYFHFNCLLMSFMLFNGKGFILFLNLLILTFTQLYFLPCLRRPSSFDIDFALDSNPIAEAKKSAVGFFGGENNTNQLYSHRIIAIFCIVGRSSLDLFDFVLFSCW